MLVKYPVVIYIRKSCRSENMLGDNVLYRAAIHMYVYLCTLTWDSMKTLRLFSWTMHEKTIYLEKTNIWCDDIS